MRYWPVPPVTTDRTFSISAGLDASTVTPGSTAPDASFTCPAIDACARTIAGAPRSSSTNNAIMTRSPRMNDLLEIELHPNLCEAGQQDRRRPLPGGKGIVHRQHRVDVEQVIDVEIH